MLNGSERAAAAGRGSRRRYPQLISTRRFNSRDVSSSSGVISDIVSPSPTADITWDFKNMTEQHPEVARRIDAEVASRIASLPDTAS